ncbi:putative pentatricopeptide repeat-containing protein at5g47460 [Phtheirospermum japonicum]|uniref:Putative pentatricopeptide repeat-containing protein at5g47460 n=1 Tax=Phtheirospermum japonicum TaxID=374723 RepID=A0A830BQ78_9LAMI|nr:putative pentatricopeptide repeat-containing protein at5g47460 [Phtheirospermum japonicum]
MLLPKLPLATPPIFFSRIRTQAPNSINRLQFHLLSTQQISKNYQTFLEKDSITSWASVLSEITPNGQISDSALTKAIQLFRSGTKPNAYALVHLTRACTNTGLFSHGEHLHTYTLKSGFISNAFVSTALINFYVRFDSVNDARKLFVEMPERTVVSWNSLISGYVHSGQFRKALEVFVQLERSQLHADSYSFTAALSACGHLRMACVGKTVHSKIVKRGVDCSVFVSNCLIDMYGKCGYVVESMKVFEYTVGKDNFSWNSILAANARNGKLKEAFNLLHQMPNPDTISYNELIHGIAQFGELNDAVDVLSKIPNPNSSSWNSIITGYGNRGRPTEAFECFRRMHNSGGARMDEFTFSSILSGIASLSAIVWGSIIHCCSLKSGLNEYVVVGSAIMDMYFKCGRIDEAENIFQSLPERNLVTWNILISGHAHNGNSKKVIELFEKLKTVKNLEPDEITFLSVLSACWHSKISIEVASKYFETMIMEYMIDPLPEHCSLMIKMMGREGDVSGAEKMIVGLGFDRCGVVWKSLLGACVACGDIQVADVAAKKLIELEGDSEFVYVMMSNIYALSGKWEDVGRIRKAMKEKKVWKGAGFSWIDVQKDAITSELM